MSKMLTKFHISGRIQNMGWIQLESTSEIMLVGIENASFGYDLTKENLISEGPGIDTRGCIEK